MKIYIYKIIILYLLFFNLFCTCTKDKKLHINNHALTVEVADSEESRSRGLMFRKDLTDDRGMLFIFNRNRIVSFWMKNTYIPLSIAFINSNHIIVQIEDMYPLDEESRHISFTKVKYALEVNQGWFKKKGIKAGDKIQGL